MTVSCCLRVSVSTRDVGAGFGVPVSSRTEDMGRETEGRSLEGESLHNRREGRCFNHRLPSHRGRHRECTISSSLTRRRCHISASAQSLARIRVPPACRLLTHSPPPPSPFSIPSEQPNPREAPGRPGFRSVPGAARWDFCAFTATQAIHSTHSNVDNLDRQLGRGWTEAVWWWLGN